MRVNRRVALAIIGGCAVLLQAQPDPVVDAIQQLQDKNGEVRMKGVDYLYRHPDRRAVGALIEALNDPWELVARPAATTLGKIKDPAAVEPLIQCLTVRWRGDVKEAAAKALGEIGDRRALVPLIQYGLAGGGSDTYEALDKLKDPRFFEQFVVLLKNASWWGSTENDHWQRLRRVSWAGQMLCKASQPEDVDAIAMAMEDSDFRVRMAVASCFESIAPRGTTPRSRQIARDALLAALRREDEEVLAAAHYFFIRLGAAESEPALIRMLEKHGDAEMAIGFLNCGNPKLEAGAKQWAEKHGFFLTRGPARDFPHWGKTPDNN